MSGAAAAPVRQANTVASLDFPLHFVLLECVALLQVLLLGPKDVGIEALPLSLQGALHALAIAGSVRGRPALLRRVLFIAIAALLADGAWYAGSYADDFLDRVWHLSLLNDPAAAPRIVALISAFGSLSYALVVRALWLPRLRPAALLLITLVSTAVAAAAARFNVKEDWVIVLWWFSFSASLWFFSRRVGSDDELRGHRT